MKEFGSYQQDQSKKSTQKNQEHLHQSCYEFAIERNFPSQHLQVLNDTLAHSNDEFSSESNCYIIKTFKYWSNKTNKFFCSLDVEMLKAGQIAGNNSWKSFQKLPKTKQMSEFVKAPQGLPLDFYGQKWFQSLSKSEKRLIPNTSSVAFLQDAN